MLSVAGRSDLNRIKNILNKFCVPVVLLVFWPLVIIPLLNSDRVIEKKMERARQRLEKAKGYLFFVKKEEGFRSDYKNQRTQMDVTQALEELQQVALGAGLHITALKPEKEQVHPKGFRYTGTSIHIVAQGTENSVIQFLKRLRYAKFLCRIVSLRLTPDGYSQDQVNLQLTLEKIEEASWDKERKTFLSFPLLDYRKAEDSASIITKKIFKAAVVIKPKNIQSLAVDEALVLKDLNLVGIVEDKGVQAVIEDRKLSKTYYLSKGDCIGKAMVVAIKNQEVILEVNNERYSMSV